MDAAYFRDPLLTVVSRDHLLTVLLAVICLTLGLMAILSRARRRPAPVMIESALIIGVYIVGAWLLSTMGTR